MTNAWTKRTYSKDSESHGAALKELGKSVASPGNGWGDPTLVTVKGESGNPNGGINARYDDPEPSISDRIYRKPPQKA